MQDVWEKPGCGSRNVGPESTWTHFCRIWDLIDPNLPRTTREVLDCWFWKPEAKKRCQLEPSAAQGSPQGVDRQMVSGEPA